MLIAYEGTNYGGWQVQKNSLSIQTLIQEALSTLLQTKTDVTGSGRTDSGVHALGQTAHFCTKHNLELNKTLYALNCLLPPDIRILSIEIALATFHARYSAKGKIYRYHLFTDPVIDPLLIAYRTHLFTQVDFEKLEQAVKIFIGTHDFAAFSNKQYQGSAARCSVRTIRRFDIIKEPGGLYFEIEGDGFLYKMVRNMVGILMDMLLGQTTPAAIAQVLATKDRTRAGRTAPAQGLFLVKVLY